MAGLFLKNIFVSPDTLISQVGKETVLLNLANEHYYGLDETGSRMWSALVAANSVQDAYDSLLAEYEVDAELLRRDLTDLIEKLAGVGLIQVKDGDS